MAPDQDLDARRPSSSASPRESSKTAVTIASVLALALLPVWIVFSRRAGIFAADFSAFYVAAHLPFAELYQPDAFGRMAQSLLGDLGIHYFPLYVRPAAFALPLQWMRWTPYWTAFALWVAVQYACYAATVFILYRKFGFLPYSLCLFGIFAPPMLGSLVGQDIAGVGLLLVAGLLLLESGSDVAAGLVLGLCLYKFNLLLLLPVFLLVKKRYRAACSFAVAGIFLAALSMWLASPAAYLTTISDTVDRVSSQPGEMVSARGWFELLHVPWAYYPAAAAIVAITIFMTWRLPLREAFAAMLAGSLLCGYHVNWYDHTLLAIPFALALSRSSEARRIVAVCAMAAIPIWVLRNLVLTPLVVLVWLGPGMEAIGRRFRSRTPTLDRSGR